jgi:hypothetical protein
MELEYVTTFQVNLAPPIVIGEGPTGRREYHGAAAGSMKGPRINATLLPEGSGDWYREISPEWGMLNVRAQLKTEDDAVIFLYYEGFLQLNEITLQAFAEGRETQFNDAYWRIAPRMECGHPNYSWVNNSLFVAEGRFIAADPSINSDWGVNYKFYRVM